MEGNYRLKIKVGEHEFEAEGPSDVVQSQFLAFKEMLSAVPATSARQPAADAGADESEKRGTDPAAVDGKLSKIMKVDGRIVSLTVRAKSIDDAALLIIYGQKALRDTDMSTGGEIVDGLTATGGMAVGRVDRLLEKAGAAGDLVVTGERRGKRYRLTNTGLAKARALASELIATIA